MDRFGFKTQGSNYELYRPKYTAAMIEDTLKRVKNKNKYLDVATGTGQLLFVLAQHFKVSKGIDISDKMLQSALNRLESQKKANIGIQKKNVLQLDGSQKYDLITIGQALHWFPIDQALKKIKNSLNEGGVLSVFAYINKSVRSTNPKVTKETQLYSTFYGLVKNYFDFDRSELDEHYTQERYVFDKVFQNVERCPVNIPLKMPRDAYINYLKTYSGYNMFLKKNPTEKDPLGPIIEYGKILEEEGFDPNYSVQVDFDYTIVHCWDH